MSNSHSLFSVLGFQINPSVRAKSSEVANTNSPDHEFYHDGRIESHPTITEIIRATKNEPKSGIAIIQSPVSGIVDTLAHNARLIEARQVIEEISDEITRKISAAKSSVRTKRPATLRAPRLGGTHPTNE